MLMSTRVPRRQAACTQGWRPDWGGVLVCRALVNTAPASFLRRIFCSA